MDDVKGYILSLRSDVKY